MQLDSQPCLTINVSYFYQSINFLHVRLHAPLSRYCTRKILSWKYCFPKWQQHMHYNKEPKWSYNSDFGTANIIGCFSVFKFMHSFLVIALFLLFFFFWKIGGDFLKIFYCCRFVRRSRNKGKGNLKDKSLANDNCRRHSGPLSPSTTQLQSHINV